VAPIFICPPNADDELLRQIASYGRGYTYLLSRAGVTGREQSGAASASSGGSWLNTTRPPLQGFGISSPDQVTAAIDANAPVQFQAPLSLKSLRRTWKPEQMLAELKTFVSAMKAGNA
jgi:tryptophan synthase alpha chain